MAGAAASGTIPGRPAVLRITRTDRSSPLKLLGGWYLASIAVTFPGGAALAVAIFVTDPNPGARTYAWSWFGLLALSAICTGTVLNSVLNAPTVAENDASLAVDELLRIRDADEAAPAMYTLPLLWDFLLDDGRPPVGFTAPLIGYIVLSLGLFAVAHLRHERRTLPPGNYGTPEAA
ncbi:hypothetical protein [Amycolatopsis sp. H20-H5]|uniref:hypothetical protein n=1 Tax=Amycolatopsis sp. H20-H5 TaxID=3046309 RepID=UPI002DB63684|nr:hypothetical protein [Amycolatopsis sp. H20-H5]MEC3973894.1 hypothetical protein [Amycolatopsis sp. H20-H5]